MISAMLVFAASKLSSTLKVRMAIMAILVNFIAHDYCVIIKFMENFSWNSTCDTGMYIN